ncbi:MAG: lysophospholipid acyltransferase family protein, partial [Bacteroidota bacterium]
YKELFEKFPAKGSVIIFGNDQAPKKGTGIWTTFLNQETAVPFGAEKLASKLNLPVVYCFIDKIKRGFYSMEYRLICDDPVDFNLGQISVESTRELERDILQQPEYWLWSHRRWKRTRTQKEKLYA